MASPIITVQSVTNIRISSMNQKDYSDIIFKSNQNLVNWEVRADGTGVGQGDLVGISNPTNIFDSLDFVLWNSEDLVKWDQAETVLLAETNETFRIDNEELNWGDKTYRINIYGKNSLGEWTPYE